MENTLRIAFGVMAKGPNGGVPRAYNYSLDGVPQVGHIIRHPNGEAWEVLRVEWDLARTYPTVFCQVV